MAQFIEVGKPMLLDTCVLLWLASSQKNLSPRAKQAIKQHADTLFVSAITAFEIAVKCRSGKMTLPLPVMPWYAQALDFHSVRELPVTGDIAIASVLLPPLHNDPCDRMIVATAEMNALKIITPDRLISQYKGAEVIW